jgi:hypothetical protein
MATPTIAQASSSRTSMKNRSAGEEGADKLQVDADQLREAGPSASKAAADLLAALLIAERSLLDASTRTSRPRLEALLSEAFVEVGSSGRRYSRSQTIDALTRGGVSSAGTIVDFRLVWHSEEAALLSYRYSPGVQGTGQQSSLRVSFWVREGPTWRILYHQGTLHKTSK